MLRETVTAIGCCGTAPNVYESNCDSRVNKANRETGIKWSE